MKLAYLSSSSFGLLTSLRSIKINRLTVEGTRLVSLLAMSLALCAASFAAPPSISSLSLTSGPVGTSVTINGSNFGTTQGTSTVKFNGIAATPITSWSATQIVAPVPTGATTGNVVVTVSNKASNGVNFT